MNKVFLHILTTTTAPDRVEEVLGRYRVTVQTYELNTPVEVTVNARTGEIEKYRVHPIVVALE